MNCNGQNTQTTTDFAIWCSQKTADVTKKDPKWHKDITVEPSIVKDIAQKTQKRRPRYFENVRLMDAENGRNTHTFVSTFVFAQGQAKAEETNERYQ